MDFQQYHSRRLRTPRHEREKSRVTLQLTTQEKLAIDWLSRIPEPFRERLPKAFRELAGQAARTIARELSGEKIRQLADFHKAQMSPDQN